MKTTEELVSEFEEMNERYVSLKENNKKTESETLKYDCVVAFFICVAFIAKLTHYVENPILYLPLVFLFVGALLRRLLSFVETRQMFYLWREIQNKEAELAEVLNATQNQQVC